MEHEHASELGSLDYFIRLHTRNALTHWEMAEHFTQSAREQEQLALSFTEKRNALLTELGRLGMDNVVVLQQPNELGGIA